ncbi:MAG TPA: DUF4276 family protein, partial [Phycisphaerae bacterium]|nr:DUF4276 family protein [Phycisphaerae bacterium]
LPRLVHRLLGSPDSIRYDCRPLRSVMHVHGKARNDFARKVKGAMRTAKLQGHKGVVVVIDRDREPDRKRIGALREGRDSMQADVPVPCAVGTAVETFDAWMIADPAAIRAAGGDASMSRPDPEKLDGRAETDRHPKVLATKAFGGRRELPQKYAEVAASVDIDLLRRCCPQGFAPFAAEVEERLLPVVGGGQPG